MPYDLLDGVKVIELSMYAFAPASAAVLRIRRRCRLFIRAELVDLGPSLRDGLNGAMDSGVLLHAIVSGRSSHPLARTSRPDGNRGKSRVPLHSCAKCADRDHRRSGNPSRFYVKPWDAVSGLEVSSRVNRLDAAASVRLRVRRRCSPRALPPCRTAGGPRYWSHASASRPRGHPPYSPPGTRRESTPVRHLARARPVP